MFSVIISMLIARSHSDNSHVNANTRMQVIQPAPVIKFWMQEDLYVAMTKFFYWSSYFTCLDGKGHLLYYFLAS